MQAMRNLVLTAIFAAVAFAGTGARAQDAGGGGLGLTVGAYFSMGMAGGAFSDDDAEPKPRFAGGGAAYVDWYLSDIFALQAGMGFLGKGVRGEDEFGSTEVDYKLQAIYMEIPIGAKLNIAGFQAALLLAPAFGVGGEYKVEVDGDKDSDDIDFGDTGEPKVFNLGLKVVLGYAIPLPVANLAIVPGLSFNFDLLNEFDEDDMDDEWARWWNLMFHVGAEFGF
jgi:hypothetical protein